MLTVSNLLSVEVLFTLIDTYTVRVVTGEADVCFIFNFKYIVKYPKGTYVTFLSVF